MVFTFSVGGSGPASSHVSKRLPSPFSCTQPGCTDDVSLYILAPLPATGSVQPAGPLDDVDGTSGFRFRFRVRFRFGTAVSHSAISPEENAPSRRAGPINFPRVRGLPCSLPLSYRDPTSEMIDSRDHTHANQG